MVSSTAKTVADYLAELPEDRRQLVEAVRKVINDNLPAGFEEVMNWGMITWQVPLATWPDTYNGQPLMFASWPARRTTARSISCAPTRARSCANSCSRATEP